MINVEIEKVCEEILSKKMYVVNDFYWDRLNLAQKIEYLNINPGAKFYSPAYGEVLFEKLNSNEPRIQVKCGDCYISFDSEGKLSTNGECMLFPSNEETFLDQKSIEQMPMVLNDTCISDFYNFLAKYGFSKEEFVNENFLVRYLKMILLKLDMRDAARYIDLVFQKEAVGNQLFDDRHRYYIVYDPFSTELLRVIDYNYKNTSSTEIGIHQSVYFHPFKNKKAAEEFINIFRQDLINYLEWKIRI